MININKLKFGLIGEKLSHSLSPLIHNKLMNKTNIIGEYELFEIPKEDFQKDLKITLTSKYDGFNITIPYKIEIMKYLDIISKEAADIGSVNTVAIKDKKMIGYNTDYYGFDTMIKQNKISLEGKTAYILGTGGVSKTVYYYLKNNGIDNMFLVSRIKKNNNNKIITYNDLINIKKNSILINCTPCGMYPDINSCPIDINIINKFGNIIDLIYNPYETILIREAKKFNIPVYNGMYMLIAQAFKAQELWNNKKYDADIIKYIYDEIISQT